MKLWIDGDGCPVVREAAAIAEKAGIGCSIVCDRAHEIRIEGAEVILVDQGPDSADFRLIALAKPGDLVVTQDYGLASLCLSRGILAMDQNGMEYTEMNMDSLLFARYTAKKIRLGGGRLKGNARRTPSQNGEFCRALEEILKRRRSQWQEDPTRN